MALNINEDTKVIRLRSERSERLFFTNDNVIGSRCFADDVELVEVVIPEGIIRIEKDAFLGCLNLQRVILPDSVTDIECWGNERHSFSYHPCQPIIDLPKYLKEGLEVDFHPDHWR